MLLKCGYISIAKFVVCRSKNWINTKKFNPIKPQALATLTPQARKINNLVRKPESASPHNQTARNTRMTSAHKRTNMSYFIVNTMKYQLKSLIRTFERMRGNHIPIDT